MQITREEFNEIQKEYAELVDHRSAIISERLFDVTSYDDKYIVTVYDAKGVYNASDAHYYNENDLLEAHRFDNSDDAHALFVLLIAQRLEASF